MGREEAHHVLPGTLSFLFAVFACFAVTGRNRKRSVPWEFNFKMPYGFRRPSE